LVIHYTDRFRYTRIEHRARIPARDSEEDDVTTRRIVALGKKVRQARTGAGFTLRSAAPLLEISHGQLSVIERGAIKRFPRRSLLLKMAQVYGVPVEDFLEAAGLTQFETYEPSYSPERQFANLMLHDAFGPEGMKPEFLVHFPRVHRELILSLFWRTWYAAVHHGRTGEGPTPDEVLGSPRPGDRRDRGTR